MLQTALTLALLAGAGLLIRTAKNLAAVKPGYRTENILTMSVTLLKGNWFDFHVQALQRASALPGVKSAAFGWGLPLTGNAWQGAVQLECSAVLARRAAAAMFGVVPESATDDQAWDALAELANMTGGNLKPLFPGPSCLSVPAMTDAERPAGTASRRLISQVTFECESQVLVVTLLEGE